MANSRQEVLAVASAQKLVLWTLVTAIVLNIASQAISLGLKQQPVEPQLLILFGFGLMVMGIAIIIVQIYSVIKLCLALHEGWATIIDVLVQFIPCANLILILFLNGRATAFLKKNGVRVGLMGASRAELDRYMQRSDRTCSGCGEPLDADADRCPVCGKEAPAELAF